MKAIFKNQTPKTHEPLITLDKIIPENYRFTNLALLMLICPCNSIPLQAFTGISLIISDIYKKTTLIVNINWISYFIIYMVMVLPANYIIDQQGLKAATVISILFLTQAKLALFLVFPQDAQLTLAWLTFCLVLFCVALDFVSPLVLPTSYQVYGFSVNKFLLSKAFSYLLCSDALGFTLSTYFITKQSTKADVLKFLVIQSAIIGIIQIANILFFRGSPQNPQNYFQRKSCRNFQRNISKLASNINYLMLILAMTFIFIDLSVLFVAITQFQRAYGIVLQFFSQQKNRLSKIHRIEGLISLMVKFFQERKKYMNKKFNGQVNTGMKMLLLFLSGFFGCFLNLFYYPNQYKWKSVFYIMIASVGHCLLWLGFETKQHWLIDISLTGIGISILPLITTIVKWSAQISFPVGEGSSGGSMFFGGYTFGSIATLLFGFYIGLNDSTGRSRVTVAMLLAFLVVSFLFIMLADEKLRRKVYQENRIVEQKLQLIITSQSEAIECLV